MQVARDLKKFLDKPPV